MKIKTIQQIIDKSAPILTGVLSGILIYFSGRISFLNEKKELIPVIVSVVVTAISVLVMLRAQDSIDKKRAVKNENLERDIGKKIKQYSDILKDSKDSSSSIKEKIEEKIVQLMNIDVNISMDKKNEVDLLKAEIDSAEDLILNALSKIKKTEASGEAN